MSAVSLQVTFRSYAYGCYVAKMAADQQEYKSVRTSQMPNRGKRQADSEGVLEPLYRKKMTAVHFTTIPCEPNTAFAPALTTLCMLCFNVFMSAKD